MKLKTFMYPIVAIAFSACSNNDDMISSSYIEAQIYARLPDKETTRSDMTSFSEDDMIGITGRYTDGSTTKTMNNPNLCYYLSDISTGAWLPYSDDDKFLFTNSSEVTFSAYYPYDKSVPSTTGILSGIDDTVDYLYATKKGSTSSSRVDFGSFSHCLSKLTFTFKAGDGVTTSYIKSRSFSIKGLVREGILNTLTGEASTNGTTTSNISLNTGTTLTASIKVLPQTASSVSLSLTIGSNTYTVDIGTVTFAGGNVYNYDVTLKKSKLVVTANSITAWTTQSGSYKATSQSKIGSITYSDYDNYDGVDKYAGYFFYSDYSLDPSTTTLTDAKKKAFIGVVYDSDFGGVDAITASTSRLSYEELLDYVKSPRTAGGDDAEISENLSKVNTSLNKLGLWIYPYSYYWDDWTISGSTLSAKLIRFSDCNTISESWDISDNENHKYYAISVIKVLSSKM